MNRPTPEEVRAEPAGRRLDAWVAEYVIKWTWNSFCHAWEKDGAIYMAGENFRPSQGWYTGGPLLESCPWPWNIGCVEDQLSVVAIWGDPLEPVAILFDRTVPNDLCRAICVARVLAELAKEGT